MAQAERTACSTPIISVKGIHKSFGQNAVLKSIDLAVYPGEVVALIGGNGAGKTSTLKVVSGLRMAYRGSVQTTGRIGMLPQNPQALFVKY